MISLQLLGKVESVSRRIVHGLRTPLKFLTDVVRDEVPMGQVLRSRLCVKMVVEL